MSSTKRQAAAPQKRATKAKKPKAATSAGSGVPTNKGYLSMADDSWVSFGNMEDLFLGGADDGSCVTGIEELSPEAFTAFYGINLPEAPGKKADAPAAAAPEAGPGSEDAPEPKQQDKQAKKPKKKKERKPKKPKQDTPPEAELDTKSPAPPAGEVDSDQEEFVDALEEPQEPEAPLSAYHQSLLERARAMRQRRAERAASPAGSDAGASASAADATATSTSSKKKQPKVTWAEHLDQLAAERETLHDVDVSPWVEALTAPPSEAELEYVDHALARGPKNQRRTQHSIVQLDDSVESVPTGEAIHPLILDGLRALKFLKPTPIQAASLRVALRDGRDLIGSAETGSGKTLAFGVPILSRLLNLRDGLATPPVLRGPEFLIITPTRELALQVRDHLCAVAKFATDLRIMALVGGLSTQKQDRQLRARPSVIVATPGRLWELIEDRHPFLQDLYSSVRFLVLDEADRMVETGHFRELDQILDRVQRTPTVITWDVEMPTSTPATADEQDAEKSDAPAESETTMPSTKGTEQADNADDDEDDEDDYLDMPEVSEETPEAEGADSAADKALFRRQTLVFSATMALDRNFKKNLHGRKKHVAGGLDDLMSRIRFNRGPQAPIRVDFGRQGVVAAGLTQTRIFCEDGDKDLYLYYLLLSVTGKVMVFVNSINTIRRLVPLLTLVDVQVHGLHAQMPQRQRLKNLDRFRSADPKAPRATVLISSDVAARGIDVPAVDHVVHYQLPRTADTYVHRSGRTARANTSGNTVLLVGPSELDVYHNICKALDEPSGLRPHPTEEIVVHRLRDRLRIAAEIEVTHHRHRRKNADKGWFANMAKEMDIILSDQDSDVDSDDDVDKVFTLSKKRRRGAASRQGNDDDDDAPSGKRSRFTDEDEENRRAEMHALSGREQKRLAHLNDQLRALLSQSLEELRHGRRIAVDTSGSIINTVRSTSSKGKSARPKRRTR